MPVSLLTSTLTLYQGPVSHVKRSKSNALQYMSEIYDTCTSRYNGEFILRVIFTLT